jgi:short subunit fatty acids transporter
MTTMERRVLYLTVEVGASHIRTAAKQAIELAEKLNCNIVFIFKGIKLYARPDSDAAQIEREYEAEVETLKQ